MIKNNFQRLLNHQTKNITSAVTILAVTSLFSALLGFFRDILLAGRFGAGDELDIYYAAFRIPDFISTVLIIGAIAAAITPIFSRYLVRSREEAFGFLSNLLNVFLISLIIICLILIIFIPQLLNLITPGFTGEKRELTIFLTRIMLFSPILLGISNIISAILRVFRRFIITSLSPIMYNLGIIFGILFFVPKFGISGLAWGVVLGGFLHLLIQIPPLFKVGFKLKKIINFRQPGLKEVIKLTIPRSIGLAATQINLIVVTAIASTLVSGSIAVFNLGESLSRPLFTFIAVSYSTVAFPVLSLAFSKKNKEKFNQTLSLAFNRILLFILPLSFLLFIFREPISKILFILRGKDFIISDVSLTAACLGMFCLGIFAQGLTNLLAKAFYAFHDTKTPALASIIGMIINIIFCLLFVKLLSFPNFFQQLFVNFLNLNGINGVEVIALPFSISLSALFQFLILLILLQRKKKLIFNFSSKQSNG